MLERRFSLMTATSSMVSPSSPAVETTGEGLISGEGTWVSIGEEAQISGDKSFGVFDWRQ